MYQLYADFFAVGATPDDHTLQESESSLFILMYLDGIFSVFHARKLLEEDLDDSVVVHITPEGLTWNPYDKNYADNEALLTDIKGNLLPSEYIHREMIVENDWTSIEAVHVMDNPGDRFNPNGIVLAIRLLDKKPSLSDSTGAFSPTNYYGCYE